MHIQLSCCILFFNPTSPSYLSLFSYDPKRATAENVTHLLASGNRCVAPATFPNVDNCEAYTEECRSVYFLSKLFQISIIFLIELMKSVNDLRITTFDYMMAKDDQVSLRYSAEGSHNGEPYRGKMKLRWYSL